LAEFIMRLSKGLCILCVENMGYRWGIKESKCNKKHNYILGL